MNRPERAERRGLSLALALGVHLLFFALMFVGLQWKNKEQAPVAVELWAAMPAPRAVATPAPRPRPEPKPERRVERPAPEVAPEAPPRKADIELKQPKKPEHKAEPKPEPKPEPKKPEIKKPELKVEPKPEVKKPEPKPDTKAEPKKPEPKVEPKKVEAKPDDAKVAARNAAAAIQAVAAAAAQAEAKARAAQEVARQGAIGDYVAQLTAKVRRNVLVPDELKGNPKAVFEVKLLPSMEVLSVSKLKSSGNQAYDDSIERAISKSSPFPPLPAGVSFQQFRVLTLEFRPND
ncbi:TonB C-terminal domain-containing protein [Chitinivorax sp. PXF-14]|uniref:energy transducer TonB n=1 Tax=Chitinivorax sp. PXF-14 TaxID=3230488 RepID=UPI003464F4D8